MESKRRMTPAPTMTPEQIEAIAKAMWNSTSASDGVPMWDDLLKGDDVLRNEFRAYARAAVATYLALTPSETAAITLPAPANRCETAEPDYKALYTELRLAVTRRCCKSLSVMDGK